MKTYLTDILEHTYALGCIDLVKITGDKTSTTIDAMAEDRSVVVQGNFNTPLPEFADTFGMPNLNNLRILLNIPEYRENAKISINYQTKGEDTVPVGLHFENADGDFKNDYRFMSGEMVSSKLKTVKFKGATWHVEFEPTVIAIQRLKMQAQANSDQTTFQAKTEDGNLKFYFGDASSHAGEFVFQPNVTGSLSHAWSWPVGHVIKILDLSGDKLMQISNDGATQITVNSDMCTYRYILPAQTQ